MVSIGPESVSAVREILQLQEFYKSDISGSVYFYDGAKVLGAQLSNYRGILLEKDPPVVVEEVIETETLGKLALGTLLAYRTLKEPGIAARGKADWSTFAGSGAKSLAHFESNAIGVRLTAIASTLRLIASPVKSKPEGMSVTVDTTTSISYQELGKLLRKVVAAVKSLKLSGDV